MKLRLLVLGLVGALALVAAGCGDDDKSDSGSSGNAKAITEDIPPRSAKANIVGGNAPIEEFSQKAANDAIGYWQQLFQKNNLEYVAPTAQVVSTSTDTGCEVQFDPATKAFYLCASEEGSTIFLGGPFQDSIRTSAGDGAVAFIDGLAVAADANNQLSGFPLSKGSPDDNFFRTTLCFAGAWVKNLADRSILEQGDDAEILDAAGKAFGGDPALSAEAVKQGYNSGPAACQSGGGDGGSDDGSQPAPSPSGE